MTEITHKQEYPSFAGNWLWWLIAFYLSLPLLAYKILPFVFGNNGARKYKRRTISIFVLGDLGHSPRMCYHARSFSKLNYYVNLCGYLDSSPPSDILDDANIEIHPVTPVLNKDDLPYLLFLIQKVALQAYQLFDILFKLRGSHYIMIQNPPSVPILVIVIFFIKMFSRETKLIIDWHNLNYSIVNLRYKNESHPLVRLVKLYEHVLGKFADLNITVTQMMNKFLVREFRIKLNKIVTLYDRPADQFAPFDSLNLTRNEVFRNHELFTDIPNVEEYKILASSTSFTPDEDFNVLLDALELYHETPNLPSVLVTITGKGPMRDQFLEKVKALNFSPKIIIRNAWLSSDDYPVILSMADAGVSLHSSSSGIDLPMKIVDFFGSGVPVISLNFPAIDELVKDGVNGFVASAKATDPATEIFRLVVKLFTQPEVLAKVKEGAVLESTKRWDDNWSSVMKGFKY